MGVVVMLYFVIIVGVILNWFEWKSESKLDPVLLLFTNWRYTHCIHVIGNNLIFASMLHFLGYMTRSGIQWLDLGSGVGSKRGARGNSGWGGYKEWYRDGWHTFAAVGLCWDSCWDSWSTDSGSLPRRATAVTVIRSSVCSLVASAGGGSVWL
jgi:hypothetical protein